MGVITVLVAAVVVLRSNTVRHVAGNEMLQKSGAGRFTEIPTSVVYVSHGGTANFSWDYQVDDRIADFDVLSPIWSFYEENATFSKKYDIAFENKFKNWTWEIANTCPARLLNPTVRVSKESTATLVISNVTTADNGVYGCSLDFKFAPTETKKSQLIVTVRPKMNITGERNVTENTNVTLICSAVGPPTPNVTWINNEGVVLQQGIQSATLVIRKISREQNGTSYNCTATNNPTENTTVYQEIMVTVKFPPENATVSGDTNACPGVKTKLICTAYGYPSPTYYWFNPRNESQGPGKKTGEISINPVTGNWTCYITNGIGKGIYFIFQMTVLSNEHKDCKPAVGCTTAQIVGFALGLLIAVVIIAVITVVILKKKKEKKEWKDWTTLEKVLIVLGLLVAIVIIIVVIVFIAKCA